MRHVDVEAVREEEGGVEELKEGLRPLLGSCGGLLRYLGTKKPRECHGTRFIGSNRGVVTGDGRDADEIRDQ